MPRPEHFGVHQALCQRSLPALPRPEACPVVGGYCQLSPAARSGQVLLDGPMGAEDYGYVLEDTGCGDRPYRVQELVSGHIWWYQDVQLQSVPAELVPKQLREPSTPVAESDWVTLVPGYRPLPGCRQDVGAGPLSLGRTETAFGLAVCDDDSDSTVKVRGCHAAGVTKEWWYDKAAVRKVHVAHVPEALRDMLRPGWGDYVVLTNDAAQHGDAAEGPLPPRRLGMVVAVDDVPDARGGLALPRYVVRTCSTHRVHRYLEGAVHQVPLTAVPDEQVPPSTPQERMAKINCTLTITEPGSRSSDGGDGAAQQALPATGQPLPRAALRHVVPGEGLPSSLSAQVDVVPGRTYHVVVALASQDDDLMLACMKPCLLELYAPTGFPGEHHPLRPIPTQQQRARNAAAAPAWQQLQQQRQALCPELLPLSECSAQVKPKWAERSRGGCRQPSASSSIGSSSSTGPWYLPHGDQVLGVFEWHSGDTPLVTRPGGVTAVPFVCVVQFADLPEQDAVSRHVLHLQTTHDAQAIAAAASSSSSSIGASGSSTSWLGQPRAFTFEPRGPGGAPTPPAQGDCGASAGSSSSSSDGDDGGDDTDGAKDDGNE